MMVVSRTLRATGCSRCRATLVRAFVDSPAPQLRASTIRNSSVISLAGRRDFSVLNSYRKDVANKEEAQTTEDEGQLASESSEPLKTTHSTVESGSQSTNDLYSNDEAGFEDNSFDQSGEALSTGTPWYLEVEAPKQQPRPISDRQKLPELPSDAPDILQPLLENVSIDLGLDDLKLLDLRDLDPPPALGAKLIMVVGTARSEKHLHVSADRLCRWLRSQYKLRPHADGLLGRNELKIKLRRKARRAKMLGTSASDEHFDDGIRTGWVCVNVGSIQTGTEPAEENVMRPGFIGFGPQTEGVKIVVQMFTENKRAEMDLEGLWGEAIRQKQERDAEIKADQAVAAGEPLPLETDANEQVVLRTTSTSIGSVPGTKRTFSTLTRPYSASVYTTKSVKEKSFATVASSATTAKGTTNEHTGTSPGFANVQYELLKQWILEIVRTEKYDDAVEFARNSVLPPQLLKTKSGWKTPLLSALCSYLEECTPEKARQMLGGGGNDRSSTTFLKVFFSNLGSLPSGPDQLSHIRLVCHARDIGHSGYTPDHLYTVYGRMQISGHSIDRDTHISVLRSLLSPPGGPLVAGDYEGRPTQRQYFLTMRLFSAMNERGEDILVEDVFLACMEAFARWPVFSEGERLYNRENMDSHFYETSTYGLPVLRLRLRKISLLQRLMSLVGMEISSEETRRRFMVAFAQQKHWLAFWTTFTSPAREWKTRSPELYATMFSIVAKTGNQNACMKTLRSWVSEMEREPVPVELKGPVAEAVRSCLVVADPQAKQNAAAGKKSEWVDLWNRLPRV